MPATARKPHYNWAITYDAIRNAVDSTGSATGPVFIVGEARSGSSLLYRLLQEVPEFAPRAPSLEESHIFTHLRRAFAFHGHAPKNLYNYMLESEDHYRRFLQGTRLRRLASVPLLLPLAVGRRGYGTWRWDGSRSVVRLYFSLAHEARGGARILEKTPEHVFFLDPLYRAFPDGMFLYIHRHPIDVYSSYVRRARVDPASAWWSDISPTDFCEKYRRAVGAVKRFEAGARDRLVLLRYEDLVLHPDEVLSTLCARLGVTIAVVGPGGASIGDGSHWRPDPHLFGAVTATTKDWSEFVDAAVARRIESDLSDIMELLAYEPKLDAS
jgi:hypothetical protein